jgi:hypothetical protein
MHFLWMMAAALSWTSASTTATAPGGLLAVTGTDSHARHTHGGAPAWVGRATFAVRWDGDAATSLSVDSLSFLRGRDCDAPPSEATPLTVGGLITPTMTERAETIELSPGTTVEVTIGFPAVEAYYIHCDRFAFQATLHAGGQAAVAVAEVMVVRVEPLRNEQ